VPAQSKAQPLFSLIMKINLYDNIWGVALVYISFGLAMSMFILKSTFMSIPKSLDEAAAIEGAGFFTVFWKINLPLAKNGLATAGILMFLNNWNEYFYASLLTAADRNRTLPIALQFFNEAFSYDYTRLFAALTIVVIPGIVLYALSQEQVQASVAATGVKG
jgi:raffinose/stachyose/melibiose transport system permease protein